MSTAVLDRDTFPNCAKADVKIMLSENNEDTLKLNASVLAKDSPFFRASLERIEWSHNKIRITEGDADIEKGHKLLELDFDGGATLPLLVGAIMETPLPVVKTKREDHDKPQTWDTHDRYLVGTKYKSSTIITAYRIGFAMMYGLRIRLPADEVHKSAFFIPALVDFLDAYGLLPVYNDQVLGVIFGGSCDGYELTAGDPFRFLRVACKLQSEEIFREAMMHAIAINNRLGSASTLVCDPKWFSAIGEQRLYKQFKAHAKTFHDKVARIDRHLLHIDPMCCGRVGVARDIGLAIFRDWVAQNTSDTKDGHRSHSGITKLIKKDYDIPRMINSYQPYRDDQIINVKFGRIHRTIEDSFEQAHDFVSGVFCEGKEPTASPRSKIRSLLLEDFKEKYYYYAKAYFPTNYQYPWEEENKVKFPEFTPFESAAANEIESISVSY